MNPTGTPDAMNPMPPAGGSSNPKEAVNLPSLFIIIVAAMAGLYALYSAAAGGMQNLPPEVMENPDLQKFLPMMQGASSLGRVFSLLFAGLYGFAIFGAIKMRNLESYGMAMASAIIMVLPCTCCCFLGIPVGIWSLVVLNKPEVKAAFK